MGDLLALLGAFAIIGYLQAGAAVRKWMPIFVYALPVTFVSAVLLTLVALLVDKADIFARGKGGIFGYVASWHGWWVLYLAMVPGLVGHTGLNTLLRCAAPRGIDLAWLSSTCRHGMSSKDLQRRMQGHRDMQLLGSFVLHSTLCSA